MSVPRCTTYIDWARSRRPDPYAMTSGDLYIFVDIDVLAPSHAPATARRLRGGVGNVPYNAPITRVPGYATAPNRRAAR